MIRFATVWVNSRSCEVNSTMPGKFFKALLNAVIDSMSKWFVGSSRINKLALVSIIRDTMQRIVTGKQIGRAHV